MPHLDEGLLHAYLDNALGEDVELHLRECPECRANLEKARLLKEGADAILTGVAPVEIAMPPFEELQAKAESRGGKSPPKDANTTVGRLRSFNQLRSIAWAATVVLAVAVGWYARSTILESSQSRGAMEGETTGRLTIPLPETDGAETNDPAEPAQTSVPEEEASPGAELAEAAGGQVGPDVIGGIAVAADREDALEARRVSTPEPAEPPSEARELPAAPLQATRAGPLTASAAGANTEATAAQQELRERSRMVPQITDERAAAEPTVTLTAGGRGGSTEVVWTGVDETTAESILDGPVPTVEGLPVIAYATSSLDGMQVIRVSQQLDSGQRIELVIIPEADVDIAADAKKGMERIDAGAGAGSINTVTISEGGLRIRLTAALTTDSLRVLGQNVSIER
jgi:hypothetical protein